jgi:hypothetical protein
MDHPHDAADPAFDERARAELMAAFDPGMPPAHLLRHRPLWARRGAQFAALATLLLGTLAGLLLALRPPELVLAAIDHEYYERTLRGNFMPAPTLLRQLGLAEASAVPGYPQLMRPCDIGGRLVYHLTTFFEHGGMVTVFAFDRPVALDEGSGWWNNVHWQVMRSRDGKPLVLISEQKKALAVARASLAKPPAS